MIYDHLVVGQVITGISLAFARLRRRRSSVIVLSIGTALTAFYLVMLPSSAVGGFSLIALRYLTPGLVLAALLLGFGFALAIAINATALSQRSRASGVVGVGGLLAAVLPGSLCCTSVVPSLLATFGASVPTVLGTTGKIQFIFARYEDAFIIASIAGVVLAIVLAARSCGAACTAPSR